MLENEKKGEKLEKITWFLKGQGRIRIRIRIRKFITDPDPDPRGQKNTDPYGSGSGSGSGSETLVQCIESVSKIRFRIQVSAHIRLRIQTITAG